MHLYWRIQLDLNEMGKTLILHHPNLIRAFERWVRKNAAGLAVAQDLTAKELIQAKISSN